MIARPRSRGGRTVAAHTQLAPTTHGAVSLASEACTLRWPTAGPRRCSAACVCACCTHDRRSSLPHSLSAPRAACDVTARTRAMVWWSRFHHRCPHPLPSLSITSRVVVVPTRRWWRSEEERRRRRRRRRRRHGGGGARWLSRPFASCARARCSPGRTCRP